MSLWKDSLESFEARRLLAAHVSGIAAAFPTIQAAVDAAPAGGVVNVDSGRYAELIVIDKPLTLRGAEAGVDARTTTRGGGGGGGGGETIVRGFDAGGGLRSSSFIIDADNVTLDGFTLQDQS